MLAIKRVHQIWARRMLHQIHSHASDTLKEHKSRSKRKASSADDLDEEIDYDIRSSDESIDNENSESDSDSDSELPPGLPKYAQCTHGFE